MHLRDPAATDALGAALAKALIAHDAGLTVSLVGELGAGKTALVRATLRALGHTGAVVSPTYTLVEPYPVLHRVLYHVDLYRLGAADELEYLGVRDIDTARDWLFVEWARRGAGHLPATDLCIALHYAGVAREAAFSAHSAGGRRVLALLDGEI